MKAKISLLAIVIAGFIVLGACNNSNSSGGSSSSPAYTSGQSFGSSILGLYSIYKQSGSIDFSNPTTLLQLAQLSTSVATIKQNINNKDFYGSFVQGAILGSQQNITQNNVGNIINSLTGVDFGNIAETISGSGELSGNTITNVSNTLNSVFGMLGK